MTEINAMRETLKRAFHGTSFSPDKRADSCMKEFSSELSADLAGLENAGKYKEKYLAFVSRWAGAKSRCMSAMITGLSGFDVYRNRKNLDAERRAWEEFRAWRERYIKRANAKPTPTPEEEIDNALAKLDHAKDYHQKMIDVNKVLRMKLSDEEKIEELKKRSIDLPEKALATGGFSDYALINSRQRIKALEAKLEVMRQRIETRDSFEPIAFEGGTISIENNRVVITHDSKPGADVIQNLKARGFKWSPNWRCWCRKHTAAAIIAAKEIVGISE